MNKLTTLAAISMFAVIMGMSAIAPAMAVPKGNSGNADTEVCHFFAVYQTEIVDGVEVLILVDGEPVLDGDLSSWGILYVNSQGQLNGHTNGYGDMKIDDSDTPGDDTITTDGCLDPEKLPPSQD